MYGIYVWKVNDDGTTENLVKVTTVVKENIEWYKRWTEERNTENNLHMQVIENGKEVYRK